MVGDIGASAVARTPCGSTMGGDGGRRCCAGGVGFGGRDAVVRGKDGANPAGMEGDGPVVLVALVTPSIPRRCCEADTPPGSALAVEGGGWAVGKWLGGT